MYVCVFVCVCWGGEGTCLCKCFKRKDGDGGEGGGERGGERKKMKLVFTVDI